MNIIEAIQERRSVRSFDGKALSPELRAQLEKVMNEVKSPFGGNVSMRLKSFFLNGDCKPSPYGMIKGAVDFFLLGICNSKESALTAGFKFEQVVLKAWQLGLGTCWIAATFKGSDFDRGEAWPHGEELKIVCPVGVAAKQSIKERLTRMAMGSKNRKSFDKLFFDGNFQTPYKIDGCFGEALNMLRIAPSSTNSQPWRALVCGDTVHFYYKPMSAASVLDCGIGLCHFWETRKFNYCSGMFKELDNAPAAPDNWIYLTSYEAK